MTPPDFSLKLPITVNVRVLNFETIKLLFQTKIYETVKKRKKELDGCLWAKWNVMNSFFPMTWTV